MAKMIKITIDGKEISTEEGKYLVDAAQENGVYIPTLCNYKGVHPRSSCRVCSVKINGRPMTACTTPVSDGMKVENNSAELMDLRRSVIEALFVEGNHFCPTCEKSGNCELQALSYRFEIFAPRFPYLFPVRTVDATNGKILMEHNRCILCKRCVRGIKTKDGKSIFAFHKRGNVTEINVDKDLVLKMTDEEAQKAMDICPVGTILKKEKGFDVPIGKRKYDKTPIGND